MKAYTHEAIKRWRKENPERAREQNRKAATRNYEWKRIAKEFCRIMIWDEIKENRGRPKKNI